MKKHEFKSYSVAHYSNFNKQELLWNLYMVYKTEFKINVHNYWKQFIANKIPLYNDKIKISHLGSTKHIQTNLNASYLQICLFQAASTLNNHLANIENKFNTILNKSSIKDSVLLHQLRTINSNHTWLCVKENLVYYPQCFITDDFGNQVKAKTYAFTDNFGNELIYSNKEPTLISTEIKYLARKIFKKIIHTTQPKKSDKVHVRFPYLERPRLILDSRVVTIEANEGSGLFDYWLNISTLTKNEPILIPIKNNDFMMLSKGILGNTLEIHFNELPYEKEVRYKIKSTKQQTRKQKTIKSNKEIKITLNKKSEINKDREAIIQAKLKLKSREVGFDLGLSTLLATSEGELLGKNWLNKLSKLDYKITTLSADRQQLGLKTKCKRYDNLIKQVRGYIKSQINYILNLYFAKDILLPTNEQIKTIIIEKLNFDNPNLSPKLNRIIKNFGLSIFKNKLQILSQEIGFTIIEINPAYSSQECRSCGYVAKNNRPQQDKFHCQCCGLKEHADIHASRVLLKRFQQPKNTNITQMNKMQILSYLTVDLIARESMLITKGIVGRRKLKELLLDNPYFVFDSTTKVSGLKPMTIT